MKGLKISKELLSEVLKDKLYLLIDENFTYSIEDNYVLFAEDECVIFEINIYELAHLNLKQWASLKNVFNTIDWSGEPEEIFAKAEELINEIKGEGL